MIGLEVEVIDEWARIANPAFPIVIDRDLRKLSDDDLAALLVKAPFAYLASGTVQEVLAELVDLPDTLRTEIANLAHRFMALMQVQAVRVRVEGVTNNACKKVHADYTDVRLIITYAGPGTDYAPHGDPDCCLERVPTGAVALFKGRLFASGHPPCFHRSPPIDGTGEKRIILVIDTPAVAPAYVRQN
ncbi:MAG: DUF1826 domain-containing protein [Sphingorhabdus sp.]